jgi:hypothetical protein
VILEYIAFFIERFKEVRAHRKLVKSEIRYILLNISRKINPFMRLEKIDLLTRKLYHIIFYTRAHNAHVVAVDTTTSTLNARARAARAHTHTPRKPNANSIAKKPFSARERSARA